VREYNRLPEYVSLGKAANDYGPPGRELVSMKKDGLIDFDRQTITILDMEALEYLLL
jgi:hypothetical protein